MSSSHAQYTVELTTEIPLEELRNVENKYESEISEQGQATVDATFHYGWALIQSPYKEDKHKGILILKELLRNAEIEEERQIDCSYYIAIGYTKLGNYYEAKRYCDFLLEKRPTHHQGLHLSQHIRDELKKDGIIGMALVAGTATLIGGLAYLLRKK